ncbi:hypothetical protein F7725_008537, partial [Dissostichus mawsoni]
PFPCNAVGRNVQQAKARHGDCCGNQLRKKVVMETVAGNAQLCEAGLQFEGAEQRVEGGRGQAEAAHRHRGAPILHLTQPGHTPVLLCREKEGGSSLGFQNDGQQQVLRAEQGAFLLQREARQEATLLVVTLSGLLTQPGHGARVRLTGEYAVLSSRPILLHPEPPLLLRLKLPQIILQPLISEILLFRNQG